MAVLLTATPAFTAEQCLKAPGPKYADTANCFLRIDGKVIINNTCRIYICGDARCFGIYGDATTVPPVIVADVSNDPQRPLYSYFWKHGRKFNYGRINWVTGPEGKLCWRNKRFHMCFSTPYLICDPETIKVWTTPKEENTTPE